MIERAATDVLKVPVIPVKPERRKNTQAIADVFRAIVEEYQVTKPHDISVMALVKAHEVQHRRVYDFFNLLTYLGVCQCVARGQLAWIGISSVSERVREVYTSLEVASLNNPLESLFKIGPSPSLGSIATRFLCLYLYLGVDKLVLRQVAPVLHDPRNDRKSLERRIYLVLNFLEVLGIVRHTSRTGEYKLLLDVDDIKRSAMEVKHKYAEKCFKCSMECLLNRLDGVYTAACYQERRQNYAAFVQAHKAGTPSFC